MRVSRELRGAQGMHRKRIGYVTVVLAYLAVFGIVLGVNLLPAFGPPTWTMSSVIETSVDVREKVKLAIQPKNAQTLPGAKPAE